MYFDSRSLCCDNQFSKLGSSFHDKRSSCVPWSTVTTKDETLALQGLSASYSSTEDYSVSKNDLKSSAAPRQYTVPTRAMTAQAA